MGFGEGDEEEGGSIGGGAGGLSDDDEDAAEDFAAVSMVRFVLANRLKFFFSLSLSLSLSRCDVIARLTKAWGWFLSFRFLLLACFREYCDDRRATGARRIKARRREEEEKDAVTTGTPTVSIASKRACLKAPKKRRTLCITRKNTPRRKNGIKS
jgi:hypothetical protein